MITSLVFYLFNDKNEVGSDISFNISTEKTSKITEEKEKFYVDIKGECELVTQDGYKKV